MILLMSGEGVSDIGACDSQSGFCECPSFIPGPMAIFVDQLVKDSKHFSCLDSGCVRFISEHALSLLGKGLVKQKSPKLSGKRNKKETRFFERNAQALAVKAKALSTELNDEVISILFRDADGTASSSRGLYEAKRDSMLRGFELEGYEKGVPMVPKPKSEAWLLCAVKADPYQHCDKIEDMSGNDNSPNSLKKHLENTLGGHVSAKDLAAMARDKICDVHRIDMPSMNWFKARLQAVIMEQHA